MTHHSSLTGMNESCSSVASYFTNVSLIRSLQAKVELIGQSSMTPGDPKQSEAATKDSASGSCAVGELCLTFVGRVRENAYICQRPAIYSSRAFHVAASMWKRVFKYYIEKRVGYLGHIVRSWCPSISYCNFITHGNAVIYMRWWDTMSEFGYRECHDIIPYQTNIHPFEPLHNINTSDINIISVCVCVCVLRTFYCWALAVLSDWHLSQITVYPRCASSYLHFSIMTCTLFYRSYQHSLSTLWVFRLALRTIEV